MKNYVLLVFLNFFAISSFAQILEFKFYNSNEKEYTTTTFNKQLETEYKSDFSERIILLETTSLNDSLYLKQKNILTSLDTETHQLIFITACSTEKFIHGYHTSIKVAKDIIGTNPKFRIRILNTRADIIFESHNVISVRKIKEILKK